MPPHQKQNALLTLPSRPDICSMLGTWEILIIGIIIGTLIYPYLQRRSQARRIQQRRRLPLRKPSKPQAREVDYEEEPPA